MSVMNRSDVKQVFQQCDFLFCGRLFAPSCEFDKSATIENHVL